MNINTFKDINNNLYISLTDISKEYEKRYDKKLNISQSIKSIPNKYLIINRGRNGHTFINRSVLDIYFNTKRNIPRELIEDLYIFLKNNCDFKINSFEVFFIDIVEQFLKNIVNNISFERQKTIDNKTFDLCINDNLLIEFDENHHKYTQKNDLEKNKISIENGYKIYRVKSNCNYGYELSIIYKEIKKTLFL